jgi:hypothetical protein
MDTLRLGRSYLHDSVHRNITGVFESGVYEVIF